MGRRFATAVTAGTLGTASALGIGLACPAVASAEDGVEDKVGQHAESRMAGPGGTNLETAAEVLGIGVQQLSDQLADGATLGDLARQHEVDATSLVLALAEEQEQRLNSYLPG